jgi:dephospho-CoA kinase
VTGKPVIGVVGGIGSGKSAASAALARRGGRVIDADRIGHDALRDPAIRDRVAARWPGVIATDGSIDRKRLGRIAFADAQELKALEAIVHPWIRARVQEQIEVANAEAGVRFVVLDAALLLEAGWDDACDHVVFVDARFETRLARALGRGWDAAELTRRERAQWPLDRKRDAADAVLNNEGTPEELADAADRLLEDWGLAPRP